MKLLLFGAVTVNVVASFYLMLIAPILVYGWNNTVFRAEAAVAVALLLLIGIGGSIVGIVWRDTRPRPALFMTAIPAAVVLAGCLWTMLD